METERERLMDKDVLGIIIAVILLVGVPLLATTYKKEPTDICNTPIYKLSVNELNKAVLTCKAKQGEIKNAR